MARLRAAFGFAAHARLPDAMCAGDYFAASFTGAALLRHLI